MRRCRAERLNHLEWHRIGTEVPHWKSREQGKSFVKGPQLFLFVFVIAVEYFTIKWPDK